MKMLVKVQGTFSAVGDKVTLPIPDGAEVAGLRFYEKTQSIAVFVLTEVLVPTHPRFFLLITGTALPDNFVKYIASFLLGPLEQEVHVVEVSS